MIGMKLMSVQSMPQTQAVAAPARPRFAALPCLLAACAGGGLLWCCHYPLALGWALGWFALVPLLLLVRAEIGARQRYLFAWFGASAFFFPAIAWMRLADWRMYYCWLLLSLYCSLYFPVAIGLVRWLNMRFRLPLVLAVPLAWVPLEYFRSFFGGGFSWYLLGHTQQAALPVIQIADLGGVFVVSFLVAAVNGLLCDILVQVPAVARIFRQPRAGVVDHLASLDFLNQGMLGDLAFRRNLILETVGVGAVVAATLIYGMKQLERKQFPTGPTLALLQGNLDQRIRNDASSGGRSAAETIYDHYARLCKRAIYPEPDLVVWPETSFPMEWWETSPELAAERIPELWHQREADARDTLNRFGGFYPAPHLLGLNVNAMSAEGKQRRYSSALLLEKGGTAQQRFDKMHRVPFGEYIPFRDWLPWMNALSPYNFDYSISSGERFTRFALGKYHFGVLICYEDTDPFLARHYATTETEGAPVDFIVNMSNDGWFAGSCEHEEHLAVSRFRAIECRRALCRAVNMGISALIDGSGRVLRPRQLGRDPELWGVGIDEQGETMSSDSWGGFKKIDYILKVAVPLDDRPSLYAHIGDVLPLGCWLALGVCTAFGICRRFRPG